MRPILGDDYREHVAVVIVSRISKAYKTLTHNDKTAPRHLIYATAKSNVVYIPQSILINGVDRQSTESDRKRKEGFNRL